MKLEQVEVILVEVKHNQGISQKTGKPYNIYSLIFADDALNRLPADIGRELLEDGVVPDWIFKTAESKAKVTVDFNLVPRGFGVALVATAIEH